MSTNATVAVTFCQSGVGVGRWGNLICLFVLRSNGYIPKMALYRITVKLSVENPKSDLLLLVWFRILYSHPSYFILILPPFYRH